MLLLLDRSLGITSTVRTPFSLKSFVRLSGEIGYIDETDHIYLLRNLLP